MLLDHDRCYRAIPSRDARFDGCFVVAVRTTGIYCSRAAALELASDAGELRRWSRRWRPWRSYAGMHLWRAAATRPRRTERTA